MMKIQALVVAVFLVQVVVNQLRQEFYSACNSIGRRNEALVHRIKERIAVLQGM